MLQLFRSLLLSLLSTVRSRSEAVLKNLALRHQLQVLQRTAPRPRFKQADRLLWLSLRHIFSSWREALVLVQPQTVVKWHRLGFRLFWRWKSRSRQGWGRPTDGVGVARLLCQTRQTKALVCAPAPPWSLPKPPSRASQARIGDGRSGREGPVHPSLGSLPSGQRDSRDRRLLQATARIPRPGRILPGRGIRAVA